MELRGCLFWQCCKSTTVGQEEYEILDTQLARTTSLLSDSQTKLL
jgi:hypothetical protein